MTLKYTFSGRDGVMIAPLPKDSTSKRSNYDYSHLAGFIKSAPTKDVREFWRVLGESVNERLSTNGGKPLWISTAGGGVAWLHGRLDSRPKYYSHDPYRHYTPKATNYSK